jgi:3-phosphoshikimate 1-carboxyvinyltransferase
MTLADSAVCRAPTTLTSIGSWRVKETDRIAAMATELGKLGVMWNLAMTGCGMRRRRRTSRGAAIDTYDDHRMAMCSLAALPVCR